MCLTAHSRDDCAIAIGAGSECLSASVTAVAAAALHSSPHCVVGATAVGKTAGHTRQQMVLASAETAAALASLAADRELRFLEVLCRAAEMTSHCMSDHLM